jgi:hypothetical protein
VGGEAQSDDNDDQADVAFKDLIERIGHEKMARINEK